MGLTSLEIARPGCPGYLPDELDRVNADAAADGMICSFYRRLIVGAADVELLRSGNLPPTFYC